MYNRYEIMEAIEAANENIKTAKEQIKRAEKLIAIKAEINEYNTFGCVRPWLEDTDNFICGLNVVIDNAKTNIKRYKKMLKCLDELDELNGEA